MRGAMKKASIAVVVTITDMLHLGLAPDAIGAMKQTRLTMKAP